MNLDNKHFLIFCYLQGTDPTTEAWSLYERFYKPEFKNPNNTYGSIKPVINYKLEEHVKKMCPSLIDGTYFIINNGLDLTLQSITFDSDIVVDEKVYKVAKDYQGNKIIAFKYQHDLKRELTCELQNLKRAVKDITRTNPITYEQLFTLPALKTVNYLTEDTFKALSFDYYNFWDHYSIFENLTIEGFVCNTVYKYETYKDSRSLKVITYKDQPLMKLSTYTDYDPSVTIFNKELYEELRQYVFNLFIRLEKSDPWIEDINSSFKPIYSWDLKGKCF